MTARAANTARALAPEPSEQPALSPPLKWAGGKRWQLPHLEPLWRLHSHRRLVEPFCGGLAVVLGLAPERAILNDINPHLISFYTWLRRGLKITLPLENDEALFYEHRHHLSRSSGSPPGLSTQRGSSADSSAAPQPCAMVDAMSRNL